ncbi:hypothetical protein [Nannocystis pusilla]|uniref:hypothetical protein n=1 Tax=Nannocystis pusilla TaxID=889268 RepID=UPI003B7C63F8
MSVSISGSGKASGSSRHLPTRWASTRAAWGSAALSTRSWTASTHEQKVSEARRVATSAQLV